MFQAFSSYFSFWVSYYLTCFSEGLLWLAKLLDPRSISC